MYKLLQANFFRLKKDIIFWLFIFMSFGMALFTVFRYKMSGVVVTLDKVMNQFIVIEGFFVAIFISLFIGREYSDGIIRNKIVPGHKRRNIYLSNLLISIVTGIIGEIIYIAVVLLIGTELFGKMQIPLSQLALIMVNTILVIIAYCSIFLLFTMMCSEITISTVICIILFIAMYVICSGLVLTVYNTPYITTTFIDEQGETHIIDSYPNPNYPSRMKMNIAKTIYFSLPIGQAIEISNEYNDNFIKFPLYSIASICIVNICGIYLFNKKELN